MKNCLFCIIVFLVTLAVPSDIYGINIPFRYGCDTIFIKGDYARLKQVEQNIRAELDRAVAWNSRGELHILMGDTQKALGNFKSAQQWYNSGIGIYRSADLGKQGNENEQYSYFQALYNFAELQVSMGADTETILDTYMEAVEAFGSWMQFAQDKIASDKYMYARFIYGNYQMSSVLGIICSISRDFSQAVAEFEESMRILKEDAFPGNYTSTVEYATILGLMGDVYERSSNYEQALEYFSRAAETAERVAGKKSLIYAQYLSRLGGLHYTLNGLDVAANSFLESIQIYADLGYKSHSELGIALSGMGMVALNAKLFDDADEFFRHSYQMQCEMCGEKSYRAYMCKFYAAYPLVYRGEYSKAWDIVEELMGTLTAVGSNLASDGMLQVMSFAFDIGLLREEYDDVIDMQESVNELLAVLDNVSHHSLRNIHLGLGRAYRRKADYKGAVEQFCKVLEIQRTIAHDNFSFLAEQQRSQLWELDESRMNSIFCANISPDSSVPGLGELLYDAALLNKGILLQASINLAEVVARSGDEELKKKFNDYRLAMQTLAASGKGETDASRQMEQEIVAMAKKYGDFMEYTNITWQDVKGSLGENDVAIEFVSSDYGGIRTYSAVVLRKDMVAPRHIRLFDVPIGERSALQAPPGEYPSIVSGKVWGKSLLEFLKKGDNVYFVPTGELYNIALEYIPLSNGVRMSDEYRMHRLSSTRELAVRRNGSSAGTGALFGGLNYNSSISEMELYAYATRFRGVGKEHLDKDRGVSLASWNYLPGTAEEVKSITATLAENRYDVAAYTGNEGVEETFKALSGRGTEILHIATHGFYLPEKGDPLQNSGLVFSGANNFWNVASSEAPGDIDDGILTAKEISHLNLQGADLVVMSACQTGLGEVTGEGVFGLQRAFKMAGVQTLLMSLWEVDDEATQLMMSEFYKAYTRGATKRQALETAQQKIRQHTFYRNGRPLSGEDPYFWAAFIMMD